MHNLIDREALKQDVRDVVFRVADTPLSNDAMSKLVFQMGELVRKKIDEAPGVDTEPVRHGVWKHDGENFKGGIDWYHCSECNCAETGVYVFHPYCSMCGAKMEIEK